MFKIDAVTLKELGIFSSDQQEECIFNLFDHTVTEGGHYYLKKHFQFPLNNREHIVQFQDAIKTIATAGEQWKFPFEKINLRNIEFYLGSNIDSFKGETHYDIFVDSLSLIFSDRQSYSIIQSGIREVSRFLKVLSAFHNQLQHFKNSSILGEVYQEISQFMEDRRIKELLEMKQHIPFLKILHFDKQLRIETKQNLKHLINNIYKLDALTAMAKANEQYHLSFPEITDNREPFIRTEGLYHLLVENPHTNPVTFSNRQNIMFLTGPNMAGKTTYLKSVGIAVYLAHLGSGVPASTMQTTVFNGILTNFSNADSIKYGYSYYLSEVRRIREAAQLLTAEKKVLLLFDEPFKGTNVKDAFDATALIISGLVEWELSVTIIASHLSELETELKKYPGIQFACFTSDGNANKPSFNYQLKSGVSNERLGLWIIKNEKVMYFLLQNKKNENGSDKT